MGLMGPTFFVGAETAPAGTCYHYTSFKKLGAILAYGSLRPHSTLPMDRYPLVWTSLNGVWEPASGRALLGGQPMAFDVQSKLDGGLARLLVESHVFEHDWRTVQPLIDPRFRALCNDPIRGQWIAAHCHQWYATRKTVHRQYWLAVQVWYAPSWRDVPYSWERYPWEGADGSYVPYAW